MFKKLTILALSALAFASAIQPVIAMDGNDEGLIRNTKFYRNEKHTSQKVAIASGLSTAAASQIPAIAVPTGIGITAEVFAAHRDSQTTLYNETISRPAIVIAGGALLMPVAYCASNFMSAYINKGIQRAYVNKLNAQPHLDEVQKKEIKQNLRSTAKWLDVGSSLLLATGGLKVFVNNVWDPTRQYKRDEYFNKALPWVLGTTLALKYGGYVYQKHQAKMAKAARRNRDI